MGDHQEELNNKLISNLLRLNDVNYSLSSLKSIFPENYRDYRIKGEKKVKFATANDQVRLIHLLTLQIKPNDLGEDHDLTKIPPAIQNLLKDEPSQLKSLIIGDLKNYAILAGKFLINQSLEERRQTLSLIKCPDQKNHQEVYKHIATSLCEGPTAFKIHIETWPWYVAKS